MSTEKPGGHALEFKRRSRGVVWVCDLAGSSKYLNDDKTVADLERFLQRFVFIARGVVDAAQGTFIKWTGDGFLAWFPTPIYRQLGHQALAVFNAAWHLSFLVNVTQLGLSPVRKFRIRHGVTHEQDALLIHTPRAEADSSLDIIGRAVVLAFRLSSIDARFPGIATQQDLVAAARCVERLPISFSRKKIGERDKLKFFKGQLWQTNSICVSVDRRPRRLSTEALRKGLQKITKEAQNDTVAQDYKRAFSQRYQRFIQTGPAWCRSIWKMEHLFLHRMFDLLKQAEAALE